MREPLPTMFSLDRLYRTKDYVLLLEDSPTSTFPARSRSRQLLFLLAILALSVLTNIVLLCKGGLPPLENPLDDYQQLKRYPLVNASLVNANLPAVGFQKSDYAIVTTLFTDSYAPAVATLGHSLRKTNTMARLIVLYLPSHISREALCIATSSGFVPHPVERIPPKDGGSGMDPHFLDTYTKLQLWRLDTLPNPVRALVYLDSDTLALRNFDELFLLPHHFAAAPDIWPETHGFVTLINSGVMFIRPDAALYDAMVDSIPQARYQRRMGDQGFLDQFFATDVVRLPYAYNANIAIKMRSQQTWAGIKNETRLIHYTVEKPFVAHGKWKSFPVDAIPRRVKDAGNAHGGLYREEMELWGNMWQETQSVYSTEFSECRGR